MFPTPASPISQPLDAPGLPSRPELSRLERMRRTDELLEQLRSCSDSDREAAIREELVAVTMPVAAAIARRYRSRGVALDDLRQVAYLALTKAVHRFDVDSGHALLSFCVPTIRGEICRYFRDQGWTVRPPRRVQELQSQVNRAESDLSLTLGRPPTPEEIAEELGQPVEEVHEAQAGQGCFAPSSLDRPVGDGDDGQPLGDLLPSEDHDREAAEARVILEPAVRELSRRDRRILELRFVEGLTQREIADDIGVTQMQVSRLLSRIYRDLRQGVGSLEPAGSSA